MTSGLWYLGGLVDPASGDRLDPPVRAEYDRADLTTHGVIVGMTGSGKTGLGVIFLEEALLSGVPALILDPKGDMTNLLLTFPDLLPGDFEPWIDGSEARRAGKTRSQVAAETADLWRNGLASWDQDGERIRRLREAADFTIYTPGSAAGIPLDVVGSLRAPGHAFDDDAEGLRDEIEGFVSGLLGLVGVDADPISSREHILLATIIEHHWQERRDVDLHRLLTEVQTPPMRKLGVFDVDDFFPPKDRTALAMRLNGLVASPAFESWRSGPPLDIDRLLHREGRPQASILYLAHLSDEERQFVVTLVLSKLVTWMRAQPGTGDLRALAYMDEVFGFVPPSAQPPAKKPILTLLKQARAFGVGLLLSTQNPVDLDYKAMSNAGTWCIGRLQTERDKARILEALQSARGDTDVPALDRMISDLGKRRFLLHNTRDPAPVAFATRWAMSYLRGPLTRQQVEALMDPVRDDHRAGPGTATVPGAPVTPPPASPRPEVAAREVFVAPSAPWLAAVGGVPGGSRLHAALAVRVGLLFDDRASGTRHEEEWEAIFHPLGPEFDADGRFDIDYDDRDFVTDPPAGAEFLPVAAPLDSPGYFRGVERAVRDHVWKTEELELHRNRELKLFSRPGESRDAFTARCDREAEARADAEVAERREEFERRARRLRDEVARVERRLGELRGVVETHRQEEILEGIGGLLGGLLGGRSTSRSASRAVRKRSETRRREARARAEEDKLADAVRDLQDLEDDALADIVAINDAWEARGAAVDPLPVPLEKSDIAVGDVTVVWLPMPDPG